MLPCSSSYDYLAVDVVVIAHIVVFIISLLISACMGLVVVARGAGHEVQGQLLSTATNDNISDVLM